MAANLPSCFFIQFLERLLKFLVNFILLKYVKSQRSYGFLITKELIFGFQILAFFHFSASLTLKKLPNNGNFDEHIFFVKNNGMTIFIAPKNAMFLIHEFLIHQKINVTHLDTNGTSVKCRIVLTNDLF